MLDEIQKTLFERAASFKNNNTVAIDDRNVFYQFFTPNNQEKPEIHGGFVLSQWCGSAACELKTKNDLGVTIRCVPFDKKTERGKCVCCGETGNGRVVFAKAY